MGSVLGLRSHQKETSMYSDRRDNQHVEEIGWDYHTELSQYALIEKKKDRTFSIASKKIVTRGWSQFFYRGQKL